MRTGQSPIPTMLLTLAGTALAQAPSLQAQYFSVYGSPSYDPVTSTGFNHATVCVAPGICVNDSGTAVGWADKQVSGIAKGTRPLRWNSTTTTELGILNPSPEGAAYAYAYAVNSAGMVVGKSDKYSGDSSQGSRAVRWGGGGTTATELGHLGLNEFGVTEASACAVNDVGTAVGWAYKFVNEQWKWSRAVLWDPRTTTATELGNLGTDAADRTDACAFAVNSSGTAVGWATFFGGTYPHGPRPVRWAAGGTNATGLATLGTDPSGHTEGRAYAINDSGTAVGYAYKYVGGTNLYPRAMRWGPTSPAATELGNLGTDPTGITSAYAYAVNASGTAVGRAEVHGDGRSTRGSGVRWDANGTNATELGNLGTDPFGSTDGCAWAIDDAGVAVGYALGFAGGVSLGSRAVMWGPDGIAVDLNTLVDPASGWTLLEAIAISRHGQWIAGLGTYDPDGPGPLAAYDRDWVMQVRPRLSIMAEPRNPAAPRPTRVVICWPGWAANYVLEAVSALPPPGYWQSVTNCPVVVSNTCYCTNDAAGLATFYRLRQ
ncbi:MAG: DUF3466 family protein [Verrucomicrobia bacterium]|nr:DUF3466 family protein [Verrucomicrobiota bacterium]